MAELYSLPDGWEWKTLSDIFNIERGGSPRPIKDYITYDEDGINWIKISDATKGDGKYIESTEQKIKPSGLKNTRLVVDGDFIMSNSMSFGKPYIVKTKGAIHDGWLLMREKIENNEYTEHELIEFEHTIANSEELMIWNRNIPKKENTKYFNVFGHTPIDSFIFDKDRNYTIDRDFNFAKECQLRKEIRQEEENRIRSEIWKKLDEERQEEIEKKRLVSKNTTRFLIVASINDGQR